MDRLVGVQAGSAIGAIPGLLKEEFLGVRLGARVIQVVHHGKSSTAVDTLPSNDTLITID